jgi:hypothetical protein
VIERIDLPKTIRLAVATVAGLADHHRAEVEMVEDVVAAGIDIGRRQSK